MGDGGTGAIGGDGVNQSHALFDNFVQATTCKGILKAFQELCEHLEVKPSEHKLFYHKLKSKLNYWKAKALWAKLDKRASQKEYKKGRACANIKCLIIGSGPCGLRTAIELAFLGAKVVILEKRDAFSRNNVLHLWPFTIQDLRGLGAKKFYGKFCAGAIDHISIRQLQLMLLKMALLLGIEIHVNVEFKALIEPPEEQGERIGWRAEVHPRTHPVSELEFDVIIGADGRRNTLPGFRRKEFRGKLAIAITANFINRNTTAEAKVEEISGVAFIFNQKFFQDLREATGIDLENIVYYKDDTHYFVMTAKKQSLLEKGVILRDYADTELLLSRANVDQAALLSYACEAADFSTNHQLPTLDFAINHYGQPDVAMFDFTCMYASENAAMVRQRNGHKLLVALVGDSLLEPFWPMGTGIARGFLAAMDSGWMVKSWAQGKTPLEVLAERESIYRLLPQTTPENVSKNFSQYSVDPTTRYPNISLNFLRPSQVRHLFDTGERREICIEIENVINSSTPKLARNESIARSSKLLNWCQRQTEGYRNVNVMDLTMSWKSGLALCALIHRYRPDLIDFDFLDEQDHERNNQLAFDVAEKEFGISPCMTGKEMSSVVEPDKLSMVMYLTQFYEMFKDIVPPGDNHNLSPEEKAALIASTKSPISFFSKLGQSIAISRKRNPKDKKEKDVDGLGKRRKTSQSEDEELCRTGRDDRPCKPAVSSEIKMDTAAVGNNNKVKVMATQLLAKFEENAPAQPTGLKRQGDSLPNFDCLFSPCPPQNPVNEPVRLAPVPAWRKRRTQQQEKLSIRYKEMIKCQTMPHRGEQARSGADQMSSSGSRSCPKKTILLPSSSSTSSLSLHSENILPEEEELEYYERPLIHGEWKPLHLTDPGPIHIPGVQERAERLLSKFKSKPNKPPKPKKKPTRFFLEQWRLSRGLNASPASPLSSPDVSRKEPVRPLDSGQLPIFVLSIQERAEQLASQLEGKPAGPQLKKKPSRFFMEQWHLARAQSPPDPPPSTSDTLRQHYVRMYTGGVSTLAEQIASQLQSREDSKPSRVPEQRDLGSLRKEFPANIGGSDVCFFCRRRVYVMERLSAEGKFFHRTCFKCDYCGTTLRLSSYAFDVEDGKFYCKPHYCYRLSGYAQRKRPAPSPAPVLAKENQMPQTPMATVDAPGRVMEGAAAPSAELQPSALEVNGLQEASLAKRLRGTPERIELENYRLSLQREEELEEVPEETLAEHNLSSVLDKPTDVDLGSSSSESDMEEEDEQEEAEVEEQLPSPSDLGGVPWKEAVELHAKLRGDRDGEADEALDDAASRDGDLEEEEDEEEDEEEEEEDEESSEEGDYCPWDKELQSGLWLEKYLTDEEDVGTFKARNVHIQQVLQPVDPSVIPGLTKTHLDSEGDEDGPPAPALQPSELTQPSSTARAHTSTRHEAVRVWLESLSGEPCEDEDLEAEAGSPDVEPGTELDQDDIPSDAEAEARLHQSEPHETPVKENGEEESVGMVSSVASSSIDPVQKVDVVLSPLKPSPEPKTQVTPVKSPGSRFFTDPFLPEEALSEKTSPSPPVRTPLSPSPAPSPLPASVPSPTLTVVASPDRVPASSPLASNPTATITFTMKPVDKSPILSAVKSPPICSQPTPLPETHTPKSPVYPHRSICPLTGNPLSPICAQPLPCHEPSSPLTSDSPVRTQPVPAVTSTPMAKTDKPTTELKSLDSSTEELASKKTDIIEEFWLKSAEIRKSLGLSPLDRSSKILEKSAVNDSKQDSIPAKTHSPDVSQEQKPVFTGRTVIRRLNITLEGQVITPIAPIEAKSDGFDIREISSSSGLGLNGSLATSQTVNSDSYNTSDSTMLTPPSSPPPPVPANQSPAVLRQQRHQVSWSNRTEKLPSESAKEPAKPKTPVPAPRTQLSPVSVPRPVPRKASSPVAAPETAPVVVMREKKKSRPAEVRKSFVETVEEIPFADDVEEAYDERTPETSMNKYSTPPTSKPSKPPLHLALAMENGKPKIPVNPASKIQRATQFSPEAKEIAKERIRAREKSVKSQVLKDAMAKQLNKMKESDTDKEASPKVAWSATPDSNEKTKKSAVSPKTSAVKALESKKADTVPERFFSSNKSLDSSVASSDGSSTSKSKKRSSLFSPRKNKKEKKAKNDSSRNSGTEETPPKHKSLWKAVFSGYKKDKKKKDNKSCPSTPSSSSTTQDSGKKRMSPLGRSSDLKSRRNLSVSEDSDLSCDDVLERSSQKSKADRHTDIFDLVSGMQKEAIKEEKLEKERRRELKTKKEVKERRNERVQEKDREKEKDNEESVYVPHALAFKRSYATKKTYTEEELNAKLTRRVQKAARRQAKQEELKRLHRAQIIQRQLEQVEEKQRQLEERGVAVEKALRGEAGLYKGTYTLPKQHKRRSDYWGDSNYSEILDMHLGVEPYVGMPRRRPLSLCPCWSPEGMGKKDDPKLMQEWFKLVQEKNALVRYESELMIFARELELEDRQSRLQQELRERMAVEDHLKSEKELAQEKQILNEMLEVVEQRDALVALLEEQRLREKEEDKDLEAVMLSKGFNLNWA
ncbi:protein-methionine sulfoxide oxidase mical3a [Nematolebias whitei]|uniref:protein-methionine sulfoxide oxidase mical3a n=1 Tax=Nematolebias whitei TaxID=451745 RepID=UPI0018982DCB|nr:protein-methionine sulfoxide oxidase mical3a [Nematolebias whitei]